jgi:hypothetical protein
LFRHIANYSVLMLPLFSKFPIFNLCAQIFKSFCIKMQTGADRSGVHKCIWI